MSNYTKSTNFATKDNLPTGDPLKIVKGTEIDTEFNNIATAISTKTDNASAAITGGSITGITDLAIADGGTGASTATAAINNLLPSQTSNANKYLQTDGTNVSWDAVSLSTADITGTLPIANGGTGTTSTTFVNLASNVTGTLPVANGGTGVTSSTGTGNVVLSNSPTLVTPALGTPASGVATNLTGLPLSTGITGLGTGVATALAINTPNTGAIVVNGGALGTPSSGVVTNLTGTANININGQVGSSTPNSGNFTTLSASSTVNISGGTVDGVAYLDASKNLTTGSVLSFSGVHLTSNRNKDTTYSGTDYTTYPNGFILQNSATPATGLFNSIYFKNNANMQNVFGVVQNSSGYGDFVWAGYSGSYAEWMRLSSSGLTLTSNPTLSGGTANGVTYLNGSKVLTSGSALTFDGTNFANTSGNIQSGTDIRVGIGINTGKIYFNNTDVGIWRGSANSLSTGAYLNLGGYEGIVFATSPAGIGSQTEGMRLTSTGLGIGTSSPAYKLDVLIGAGSGSLFRAGQSGVSNGYTITSNGSALTHFWATTGEAMRLDSAGNLGLGVTPSATWFTGSKVFQIGTTGALWNNGSNQTALSHNAVFNNSDARYLFTEEASYYSQLDGQHRWFNAPSGTAGDAISFSQAMTLDASGNLGVGTTSPFADSGYTSFTVNGNSTGSQINFQKSGTVYGQIVSNATNGLVLNAAQNTPMLFYTAGSERARIDSSGNLLVGTTSATQGGNSVFGCFSSDFTSKYGIGIATTQTSGTGLMMTFVYNGTQVGSIANNSVLTAYNTSSDYRLKNSIAPMTGALAKVAQLKPCTYKWNTDNSDGEGFIAHELAEVVPQCVTGVKDGVNEDGTPKYQGIDTSFLVATLTAAIQEQQAIIESLKARLDAANL